MHPAGCTYSHHDVTDVVNHGTLKNEKNLNITRTEHKFSAKERNSEPMPQMAHLEKLLFCCGCNL